MSSSNAGQVKEDFLEEDPEIRSQKFVLLSFLSPENVLENKDRFFFGEFLKQYEIDYKIKNLEGFLVSIARNINDSLTKEADRLDEAGPDLSGAAAHCRKSRLNMGTILETYHQFVKGNDAALKKTTIKEDYEDFMFKNQVKLEEAFFEKNEFRTSIRGLKVRGVTATHGEAVALSKKLQRSDTLHNIFLGEVGKWLPWDPKPHQVQDQEYAEDQLNALMKNYKNNEESREKFVAEQRSQMMQGGKRVTVPDGSNALPEAAMPEAANALPEAAMPEAANALPEAANAMPGAPSSEPSKDAGGSSEGWGSMFEGPADLVMQRKMAKQDTKADTETATGAGTAVPTNTIVP